MHFDPSAWALCSPLGAFLKEPLPTVLRPCASLAWICGRVLLTSPSKFSWN